MLDAALDHASRGVAVFPVWHAEGACCGCRAYDCESPGKHPIGSCAPNGLKDATTDKAKIRQWWSRFPKANIGLRTGIDRTVLDVDPAKGGHETLATLEAKHGPLPVTPKVLTGGGGEHYHFTYVPGVRNSAGKLGPGLDTRGEDGYVLGPPSNHISGGVYLEDVLAPLYETPLAQMPPWLVALAMAATSGNGRGPDEATDWAALLTGAPEGQRHATAVQIAGHYLGKRLPPAEVELILLGFADRCTPPFPASEARRIVHDLAAKDAEKSSASSSPTSVALPTRTWAEMVSAPRRAIEYHWAGWIPLAAVALLVGAGEAFKSWLALMLAISTAAGRALLATPGSDDDVPLRQGPVLYITAENAIEEEQRRCQLLQVALDLPADLPITFLPAETLNLSRDEDYAAVVALVEQIRPVLIVVDSAIAVSGVAEEKDNNRVREFMQGRVLPLARQHKATVLVLGHSPKPSQQPGVKFTDEHVARGAGDWRNASDVVLYLRREPSLGAAAVVLRHAKVRVGSRHAPLWFTLDEADNGRGVRLTLGGTYDDASAQASGALAKAIMAALDVLRVAPGIFAADLVKRLEGAGMAVATGRRAVGVLRGQAKHPWPCGPLAGKVFAVVDESREGKRPRLVLDPSRLDQAAPASADEEGF
jgi:putative DNA primase/helicase